MTVLNPMVTAPEPPPIKRYVLGFGFLESCYSKRFALRYYGRNRGKDSDSELSLDSDGSEEEQPKK